MGVACHALQGDQKCSENVLIFFVISLSVQEEFWKNYPILVFAKNGYGPATPLRVTKNARKNYILFLSYKVISYLKQEDFF